MRYNVKGRVAIGGPRLAFICRDVPGSPKASRSPKKSLCMHKINRLRVAGGLVVESGVHIITINFATINFEDTTEELTGQYTDGTEVVPLIGHRTGEDNSYSVRMDAAVLAYITYYILHRHWPCIVR